MKYLFKLLFFFIVADAQILCGTGGASGKHVTPSLNKQRASNAFYQTIHYQKLSASRFLPLFNVTGIGTWSSPRTVVTLDGLPYNGFPFGMQSIDLFPIDLITVDTLSSKTYSGVTNTTPVPGGVIDISRRPIPDSFNADIRLFTGSETGDPLIHIFTRPERVHINKNKVGPSFALSLSNAGDRWEYRISGGGFFYFSTGSVNDYTINSYNPGLMPRQNRQVKAIGEAVYRIDDNRAVDIYAAGINLFGWEMSPFTSLFNHYTNISTTGRIRYTDTSTGISAALVRDESFLWTKEMANARPGSIRTTEWTLYPVYDVLVDGNFYLSVFSNFGLLNVIDLSVNDPNEQSLILKNVSSVQWGGGVEIGFTLDRFTSTAGMRIDSKFESDPGVSGEITFSYIPNRAGLLQSVFSSTVYIPDYLERYGRFLTQIETESRDNDGEFIMTGNPDLESERIHEVKLGYTHTVIDFRLHTEIFGRWTENQVVQRTLRSFRPVETGELLRSAEYINDGRRFVPGLTAQLKFSPFGFLVISTDHQFTENSDMRSLSRYRNINSFEFALPLEVMLDISLMHIGKSVWKEFMLAREDDPFLNKGNDGMIPGAIIIDITVSRRFEKFYFAEGLEISIQAQNFLNESFRRIPVGNFIDRAVFVYVSFGL